MAAASQRPNRRTGTLGIFGLFGLLKSCDSWIQKQMCLLQLAQSRSVGRAKRTEAPAPKVNHLMVADTPSEQGQTGGSAGIKRPKRLGRDWAWTVSASISWSRRAQRRPAAARCGETKARPPRLAIGQHSMAVPMVSLHNEVREITRTIMAPRMGLCGTAQGNGLACLSDLVRPADVPALVAGPAATRPATVARDLVGLIPPQVQSCPHGQWPPVRPLSRHPHRPTGHPSSDKVPVAHDRH